MKNIVIPVLVILCLLVGDTVYSDVPLLMNYQGRITDVGDAPLDTVVSITFTIYNDSLGGESKWSETQPAVTVDQGLFNVLLGSVHSISNTVFSAPNRYLGMKIGDDPEIVPRTRLVTSAYAYQAIHADTAAYVAATNDGIWETDGTNIWRMNGNAGIGLSNPWGQLTCATSSSTTVGLGLQHGSNDHKDISYYTNDTRDWVIRGNGPDKDNGTLLIWAVTGKNVWFSNTKIGIGRNNPSATIDIVGTATTRGPNDNYNAVISHISGDENKGALSAVNESGSARATMGVHSDGDGVVYANGANGKSNVVLESQAGYPNHGHAYVCDASGVNQAGMYVNSTGNGIVYGDSKSFKMANPNQPGTDIWYTCPEGPEAAAYIRGTAHLTSGECIIEFPEHFRAVISDKGMTVNLTPLSADSRGLAVTYKGSDRIVVREIGNGNGTFDFDYMVMAVRKGYEDYQVIRASSEPKAHIKTEMDTDVARHGK